MCTELLLFSNPFQPGYVIQFLILLLYYLGLFPLTDINLQAFYLTNLPRCRFYSPYTLRPFIHYEKEICTKIASVFQAASHSSLWLSAWFLHNKLRIEKAWLSSPLTPIRTPFNEKSLCGHRLKNMRLLTYHLRSLGFRVVLFY